jgi:hypothetical protein
MICRVLDDDTLATMRFSRHRLWRCVFWDVMLGSVVDVYRRFEERTASVSRAEEDRQHVPPKRW